MQNKYKHTTQDFSQFWFFFGFSFIRNNIAKWKMDDFSKFLSFSQILQSFENILPYILCYVLDSTHFLQKCITVLLYNKYTIFLINFFVKK